MFDECSDTTARRSPDHPLKEGEKDRHRLSGPLSGRGCAPTYDQPRQPILPAIIVAAQPAIVVVAAHKIPLLIWFLVFSLALAITITLSLSTPEIHLVLMRIYSGLWSLMLLDPSKVIHLTLPGGIIRPTLMGAVPYDPYVATASAKALRCLLGSGFMAIFIAAPISIWFIEYSRRRGKSILEERHERGAMLVERDVLRAEIRAHNGNRFAYECSRLDPPREPTDIINLDRQQKRELGIHQPYMIAGVPYPWRLEQSHTMLIGTTGAGKSGYEHGGRDQ